ncbi:energy-coupling factor transporter ATPase [Paenibacillus sp. HN-1]|uniref:ATP-binding cassette domain-containing protein n=1 Tax=Paenibacillus TaxID=44249 RepID=UPI001CA89040|nr:MULTISPECIES: ATP-binding cassette domain-containing protein [Paenibacillus]MBY9079980.1 energy-coupling factor transporter ATPase [Paenibacillus sp. CGMCC 1.18879]MBY9084622.1 energy-coupling factor transporter ATPase [Paenibacillus sinensis]
MAIELRQVSYTYSERSLWRQTVLREIDFDAPAGQVVGIAGATGSGKSTLLQLFNGLLRPTQGTVSVLDVTFRPGEKPPRLLPLRRRVGLVFQFPEQQMFAETLEKDLMFGPLNFGMSPEEARERACKAMEDMGLDLELLKRNPFRLSGGQMRKAAIASVLAADPEILVLDEPTASLDPVSRRELIGLLNRLCRERGRTVIVVTHRMDELLPCADRWLVLNQGRAVFQGGVRELARNPGLLADCGLAVPDSLRYWRAVADRLGLGDDEEPRLTAGELAAFIQERGGLEGRGKEAGHE